MKAKLLTLIFSVLAFSFFLYISIQNMKADPSDNISIFGICFLSAMLGINFVSVLKLYNDWVQERNRGRESRRYLKL